MRIPTFTLLLLLLSSLAIKSHPPKKLRYDSTICLLLQGQIPNAPENRNEPCYVELLKSEGGTDTLVLEGKRTTFRFTLEKNTYYALRITKSGYLPKLFTINTSTDSEDYIHKFSFRTYLISECEKEGMNSDALDFPLAIIHFDPHHGDFYYNEEYTRQLKTELRKKTFTGTQLSGNP